MQFIVGFLATFFSRFFGWVAKFLLAFLSPLVVPIVKGIAKLFSNRSVYLLMFATIGGFIAVFIGVMTALANTVMAFVPSEYIVIGRMFVPDNLSTCIAVVASAKFYQIILLWKIKVLETLTAAK